MRDLGTQFRRTLGANGFAQAVTVLGQVVILPVLLLVWGPERTGSWLVLMAMTSWLTLADLGFANVAANAMTMETAAGDRRAARVTSASAWAVWAIASALLVIVCAILFLFLPLSVIGISGANDDASGFALGLLVLGVCVAMAHGVAGAAMRAEGEMDRMVMITGAARAGEFLAIASTAALGAPFWGVALAMLGARVVVTAIGWARFHHRFPEFKPSLKAARWDRIQSLVPLSLGYFQFNIAHALSLQGVTIVLGATLGPSAVVVVTAVRTLARAGRMLAAIVIHATEPLFAQFAGRRENTDATTLQSRLWIGASLGAAVYAATMALAGGAILDVWTGGVVVGVPLLIAGFAGAVICEIFWFTLQAPFVSTNRHGPFGRAFVLAAGAGLLALPWMLSAFGILGAALATLLVHAGTLIWTLYRMRRPDMGVLPRQEGMPHAV